MNNILVLYPQLFKNYQKFHRKVKKIISALEEVNLIYPHDYNGFIKNFSKENQLVCENSESDNFLINNITHAIVFDDGEEFPVEVSNLKSLGIPLRCIDINITRVININDEIAYKSIKSSPTYEYIGRGSYWGNPYSMYEEGEERDEVIRKFKYDLDYDKFPKKNKKEAYKLAGKRLGCFCKPQSCHGDVLADFLNSLDDGR